MLQEHDNEHGRKLNLQNILVLGIRIHVAFIKQHMISRRSTSSLQFK
ncbi:hypothetical protein T09_10106 [Trichinella sp. T9]|nr:hypothetical protein T09_10106 [Trichinella sp. T9]